MLRSCFRLGSHLACGALLLASGGCGSSTEGDMTGATGGTAAGTAGSATGGSAASGASGGGLGATGGTGAGGSALAGSSGTAGAAGSGGVSGASGAAGTNSGGSFTSGGAGGQAGSGGQAGTAGQGGGGGQAGAAGQGGGGGEAGGGVPAGCPASAVMCEDFESFALMAPPNNARWKARTNGSATVIIDGTHARGSKAAHFHATSVSNNQRAYILTDSAPVFPVAGDTLYVRFMMYIGRYMSVTGLGVHNRIAWVGAASTLAGGGNGPGYSFATFNGLTIERLTNPNQGFQRNTTVKLDDAANANKWHCFEFALDNKGGVPAGEKPTSTVMPHIWQEGREITLAAGGSSEAWLPAGFEALQFSLWCPQTDPMPTDYWIDDVVVSKQRINCPPP